jgi:hypothetical protein
MRGLALTTIAYFILAIVTIVLIIALISNRISPAIRKAYCSVIRGLRAFLPLPSHMKPDMPIYCESTGSVSPKTIEVEATIPDRIAFQIASYVLACWEQTGKFNMGQNNICYELIIGRVDGEVNKDMVNQTLVEEGYPNLLEWKLDKIIVAKSIGVSYNSTSKKIEVS